MTAFTEENHAVEKGVDPLVLREEDNADAGDNLEAKQRPVHFSVAEGVQEAWPYESDSGKKSTDWPNCGQKIFVEVVYFTEILIVVNGKSA